MIRFFHLSCFTLILACSFGLWHNHAAFAQDDHQDGRMTQEERLEIKRAERLQSLSSPAKPQDTQPSNKDVSQVPPEDIPDILMAEFVDVQTNCENNYYYSSFHDCRCVAVQYLEARMKGDPSLSRDQVFKQVAAKCPDKVAIAGFIYPACYDLMKTQSPDNYRSLCECTAREVAEKYTQRPIVSLSYIESLRRNAFLTCGLGDKPVYRVPAQ